MILSLDSADAITPSRIIELHTHAINKWGGDSSAIDKSCVLRCIENAYAAAQYTRSDDSNVQGKPDILVFSAYLFIYLAKNHCFTDGNKRVAWMALADQLSMLQITISATQKEVVDFVLFVEGQQSPRVEEVIEWLGCRISTMTRPSFN